MDDFEKQTLKIVTEIRDFMHGQFFKEECSKKVMLAVLHVIGISSLRSLMENLTNDGKLILIRELVTRLTDKDD